MIHLIEIIPLFFELLLKVDLVFFGSLVVRLQQLIVRVVMMVLVGEQRTR